jgi:hypothetical protein
MIQVLIFSDVVNVMAAYQPVCKCAVHGGGWYAAMTLTTSLKMST